MNMKTPKETTSTATHRREELTFDKNEWHKRTTAHTILRRQTHRINHHNHHNNSINSIHSADAAAVADTAAAHQQRPVAQQQFALRTHRAGSRRGRNCQQRQQWQQLNGGACGAVGVDQFRGAVGQCRRCRGCSCCGCRCGFGRQFACGPVVACRCVRRRCESKKTILFFFFFFFFPLLTRIF
jgi:hypothetical protein